MACSANLFPQIGTLRDPQQRLLRPGYSGFGVTPSHIVCKILAEGINGGSDRYRLLSSIPHATIHGRDGLRLLLVTAGKIDASNRRFLERPELTRRTLCTLLNLNTRYLTCSRSAASACSARRRPRGDPQVAGAMIYGEPQDAFTCGLFSSTEGALP